MTGFGDLMPTTPAASTRKPCERCRRQHEPAAIDRIDDHDLDSVVVVVADEVAAYFNELPRHGDWPTSSPWWWLFAPRSSRQFVSPTGGLATLRDP